MLAQDINITAKNTGNTMKTIGMLGGMNWESTARYYRGINQRSKQQ
jgi:hypothetical protein